MSQANNGDKVKVHYKGKLEDGTVFESTFEKEPLEFTLGENQIIPGFESAIVGMEEGNTKTVTVEPNEAYGEHRDDLIAVVERTRLPDHINPEVGMMLQAQSQEGQVQNLTITDLSEDSVTLDGNHPLAGKQLTFEIELVEVM